MHDRVDPDALLKHGFSASFLDCTLRCRLGVTIASETTKAIRTDQVMLVCLPGPIPSTAAKLLRGRAFFRPFSHALPRLLEQIWLIAIVHPGFAPRHWNLTLDHSPELAQLIGPANPGDAVR